MHGPVMRDVTGCAVAAALSGTLKNIGTKIGLNDYVVDPYYMYFANFVEIGPNGPALQTAHI